MKNTVLKEQPITCSEVTRRTASEEEKCDDQHHFRPEGTPPEKRGPMVARSSFRSVRNAEHTARALAAPRGPAQGVCPNGTLQTQPWERAMWTASCRLPAPSLVSAEDR